MSRHSKSKKGPSPLRELVARTVVLLRDRQYRTLPDVTERNRALAKDASVSFSTIQRIADAKVGATVDTLDALARALECRPQDLLTPYFGSKAPVGLVVEDFQESSRLQRR